MPKAPTPYRGHTLRNLFLTFAVLATTITASARLGETEAELVKRFGEPISRQNEQTITQGKFVTFGLLLTFRQDDWYITCSVIDGRSAKESYHKPGDWTEDQLRTILTANAQASKWTPTSDPGSKAFIRNWRREDSGTASWQNGSGMTVQNPAYNRAKEKAETKAKADASRIPNL